jgi:hypothetical protein
VRRSVALSIKFSHGNLSEVGVWTLGGSGQSVVLKSGQSRFGAKHRIDSGRPGCRTIIGWSEAGLPGDVRVLSSLELPLVGEWAAIVPQSPVRHSILPCRSRHDRNRGTSARCHVRSYRNAPPPLGRPRSPANRFPGDGSPTMRPSHLHNPFEKSP